mmetsp:Transcript_42972/g.139456  ORF Transcript_42972/g.139456 Transcript_42972/m.139456 type:complete len:241 (+) Transcript_42972:3670-4392(+)
MHAVPQAHDAHGLGEAHLLLLDDRLGEQRGGEELAEGEEKRQQRLDGEVERVLRVGGGGEGRQPRHARGRREELSAVAGGEVKRKAVDGALQRQEAGGDVPLVLGVEAPREPLRDTVGVGHRGVVEPDRVLDLPWRQRVEHEQRPRVPRRVGGASEVRQRCRLVCMHPRAHVPAARLQVRVQLVDPLGEGDAVGEGGRGGGGGGGEVQRPKREKVAEEARERVKLCELLVVGGRERRACG